MNGGMACTEQRNQVRATYIYGAGDVRVEDAPDPKLILSTDAIVRVTRACVCGSDLHPRGDEGIAHVRELTSGYGSHAVLEAVGHLSAYDLEHTPDGYRAMDERTALKVMVTP
jgi:D-arabinose 1-dehydrogenase-like Zn-dependent alcohol dehydrogenase